MPTEFNSEKMTYIQPTNSRVAFSSQDTSGDEMIWELLSLYIDGEASTQEAAQVEQMLRHDAEYARAYAFMQKAGTTIRTIVEIEPPMHLRETILAKTSQRPTFSKRLGIAIVALRTQFAMPVGRLAVAGGSLALVIGICAGRMGNIRLPANLPTVAGNTTHTNTISPDPKAPGIHSPSPANIPQNASMQAKAAINHKSTGGTQSDARNDIVVAASKKSTGRRTAKADVKTDVTPHVLTADLKTKPVYVPKQYHPPTLRSQIASTQNVNPMMDTAVYHIRSNSDTAKPVPDNEDDLNDEHLVTGHEEVPNGVAVSTETESTPSAARKIEGKLVLSKLPPSSRHILSPGEVIRQVNSTTAVNYNAASSDDTQGRTAELRVLTSKF